VIGLILVTILLTHTLLGIVGDRRTTKAIEEALKTELAATPGTSVDQVIYKRRQQAIDVLALVTTPRVLSPKKVKEIQDSLSRDLGLEASLILRCHISKDISSTGSTSFVVSRNLDGEFISTKLDPKVKRMQLAEQALREVLEDYQGTHLDLDSIDIVDLPGEPILVAELQASRHITPFEVAAFEKAIRRRLQDPRLRLLIRSSDVTDVTSKGRILYGRAHFGKVSDEELAIRQKVEQEVKIQIERLPNMFAPNVDAEKRGKVWHILAEVVGPIVLTPGQIRTVEKGVSAATGVDVRLRAWCRAELMVDNSRLMAAEEVSRGEVEKQAGRVNPRKEGD